MNLHGLVSGAIGVVNPFEAVAISRSTGSTTNRDGSRDPTYSTSPDVAQVQPLTGSDLRQVDALNLQGTFKKFYFNGDVEAIVRSLRKGGDLITRGNASVWLTTQVGENWDGVGWCSVVATLQDGA